MKKVVHLLMLLALLVPCRALAHHGGVSVPFGPGTPIETNSPLTLPQGGWVIGTRVEQVEWRKFGWAESENKSSFTFFNMSLSYGITPYLTGSIFLPYNIKRLDTLGYTQGIGDLKFLLNLGFNHQPGKGLSLNKQDDTAVTLEGTKKTYFCLFGGVTAPIGKWKKELGGEIDPGMQSGFGSPAFTVGTSIGRNFAKSFTLIGETSYEIFAERAGFKFGNEFRANLAGVYELYGNPKAFVSKIDGFLELNYLNLARDVENGEGQPATGGDILYLTPGLRFSFPKLWNANLGLAVKVPVWKNLKEAGEQQGSEGLEKFRVIATLSFFF
ncbi:MAG: hypothetical protein M1438_17575 [Deltaproteobacteria bacterium]|nr:hypothetical protein [Deltaproteobacteria bacterium]